MQMGRLESLSSAPSSKKPSHLPILAPDSMIHLKAWPSWTSQFTSLSAKPRTSSKSTHTRAIDYMVGAWLTLPRLTSFFHVSATSQPEMVQMKFELLKHGHLDVVKGAGHLLTLEKPQESGT